MSKLPQATADLVAQDGLPRLATADDATQHVLFFDGAVRSMLASDWPPPLPTDPTPQQIAAAIVARQAAAQQAITDAAALRAQIIALAQSAVGVSLSALTAPQVRALTALLLWKAGGVKADATVRPLAEWL
jgi:hypothetical protein